MAPIRPRARAAHRSSKSSSSTSSTTALQNPYAPPPRSENPSYKTKKRIDKHALLLSRLQSSSFNPSKITKSKSKSTSKARRPGKKLVTELGELVDALPTPSSGSDYDNADESEVAGKVGGEGKGTRKIKLQKSMKSKPGAMKKRAKILEGERDRFARNLGVMYSAPAAGSGSEVGALGGEGVATTQNVRGAGVASVGGGGTSARWAAIRRLVEGT